MADLISRAAAIRAALRWYVNPDGGVFNAIKANIRSNLEQLPAVDAVPVVRCDKCMYRGSNKVCIMLVGKTQDDFYCKYGERRDGDT